MTINLQSTLLVKQAAQHEQQQELASLSPTLSALMRIWASERVLFAKTVQSREQFASTPWQGFCQQMADHSAEIDQKANATAAIITSFEQPLPASWDNITANALIDGDDSLHDAVRVHAHRLHLDHSILKFHISDILKSKPLISQIRDIFVELLTMHDRMILALHPHTRWTAIPNTMA